MTDTNDTTAASVKKSIRIPTPLWADLQASRRAGETESGTICRLIRQGIEHEAKTVDGTAAAAIDLLAKQLETKDAQIARLQDQLEHAHAEHEAKLETLLANAEATATQAHALMEAAKAPRTIEAKLYDEGGQPIDGQAPAKGLGDKLRDFFK